MPDHPTRPEIKLLDRFFYLDPHENYRWLRENAPVYWDAEADDGGIWGLSLHEDVLHASKNMQLFCSSKSSRPERDSWIPTMINLDDPLHKRRRNLVNRGFTPRRIDNHEAKIRRICTELIDRVAQRGECDFVKDIAAPLPMIMIGDMLGVKPEDRDKLLRWSDELLGGGEAAELPDEQRRAHAAGVFLEYVDYAKQVIADRREQPPQDDLVSILLHSEIDGDRLSDEEIIQESLLILIGGDETTRHVITGGMLALIQHPGERQKLIDAPSKITIAVEEMLRWVTPIVNMNRTATCDVELRGQTIREGDRVLLLYAAANRDEKAFAEPDRFDVERQPNQHVAFGGMGTHFCLGASLARLELRVMFEELLRRLPDIELAGDVSMRPSNFIVGLEGMPVSFKPTA